MTGVQTCALPIFLDHPTASGGLLIFHRSHPLADAFRLAREALAAAKRAGRNRLSVVVARRGSRGHELILPWHLHDGKSPVGQLDALAMLFADRSVSPSLLEPISAEADGLAKLTWDPFEQELTRLIGRKSDGSPAPAVDVLRSIAGSFSGGTVVGAPSMHAVMTALSTARFLSRSYR